MRDYAKQKGIDETAAAVAGREEKAIEFRKASAELRAIWVAGNEYLTRAAPWTVIKADRARAAAAVRMGLNLVHLFGHLSWPIIPTAARTIHHAIQPSPDVIPWPDEPMAEFLDQLDGGQTIYAPEVLFAKITDEQIVAWIERFGSLEG